MKRVLDAHNDGDTVEIAIGDELELRLDENPTTGVRWQLPDLVGSVVALTQDGYERRGGGVGGAATRIFTLRATSAGELLLDMVLRQAWEPNVAPAGAFGVRVRVRPDPGP